MPFQLGCSGEFILGRQGYLACEAMLILFMKHIAPNEANSYDEDGMY